MLTPQQHTHTRRHIKTLVKKFRNSKQSTDHLFICVAFEVVAATTRNESKWRSRLKNKTIKRTNHEPALLLPPPPPPLQFRLVHRPLLPTN
jgi:hypothetical protein